MRRIVLLTGVVLTLGFLPAHAEASTAGVGGATLFFNAAPGEFNTITIRQDLGFNQVDVSDPPNGPTATGAGCIQLNPNHVRCFSMELSGLTSINLTTGDERDVVLASRAPFDLSRLSFDVDLGPGSDTWSGSSGDDEVDGGPGNDGLFTSAGDDVLRGGEGFDSVTAQCWSPPVCPGHVLVIGQAPVGGDIEELNGSGSDDRLVGDGGVNRLDGQGGDDEIVGGGGPDTIFGRSGDDEIKSRDGVIDEVVCGEGDDTVIADAFDNVAGPGDCENVITGAAPITVTGGNESSTLEIRVDASPTGFTYTFTDTAPLNIAGGGCEEPPEGQPTVCTPALEVPVTVDLGGGNDTMTLTGGHAFARLTVNGGDGDDVLVASPTARGGIGEDTISGGNCGADPLAECLLEGGPDDDILTGGTGNDRLGGGTGSDQLAGNFGRDTADYSDFTATVIVELDVGSEEPLPEQGTDTFTADDVENLVAGSGDDDLTGGVLSNRIEGGGGDDTFVVLEEADANEDELVGGAGRDTVSYEQATTDVTATIGGQGTIDGDPSRELIGADVEVLVGGELNDTLTGSAATNEELIGGPGDDELVGGDGADVLDGGDGDDLVTYAGPGAVFVDLSNEDADDGHAGEDDKLLRVEDVTGGDGDDLLIGNVEANTLLGEGGDDNLVGGDGVNFLDGGPGNDVLVDDDEGQDSMEGGDGIDTADYSADTLGVFVDPEGGSTTPCNDGAQGHDCVFADVENVEGGSGDDLLTGSDAANELVGNGGADEIDGLGGEDVLVAGPGRDEVRGGDGNDHLSGGDDTDLDTLDGQSGNDILDGGPGGAILRGGDGNDDLFGDDGDDDLFGGEGADDLDAGSGDDGLAGEGGNDTLDGGLGADQPIDGGDGDDTLLYADRVFPVFVDPEPALASVDDGQIGEGDQVLDTVENLTGGFGNDIFIGTAGPNLLVGNDGDDTLVGLNGPDTIDGGFGLDSLDSQDGVRDEVFCGPSADAVSADIVDNVSVDCEVVNFPTAPPAPPAPPSVNTPPGTNVAVQPTGGAATVTFSSVTVPGQTSAVVSSSGPAVPSGFQLGSPPRFVEISTTAQFTPPVTVCLITTGITFPSGQPRLHHFENGAWRDVTTSVGPGQQVCGVVSSLSPFAVFARKRAVKVVRCVVPNVKGKTLPAARKALRRANCAVGRVRGKGRVNSQRPKRGARLRKGAKVDLVLRQAQKR